MGLAHRRPPSRSPRGAPSATGAGVSLRPSKSYDHTGVASSVPAALEPAAVVANQIANPACVAWYAMVSRTPLLVAPYRRCLRNTLTAACSAPNAGPYILATDGIIFGANGQPTTFPTATGLGTLSIYRSFAGPCALCFKTTDWYTLVPELDKAIGSVKGHFDLLTDGDFTATAYGDLRYAWRQSEGNGQVLTDPQSKTRSRSNLAQNAFIPAAVQQQLLATGATSANFIKVWSDLGGRASQELRAGHSSSTAASGAIGRTRSRICITTPI